MSKNLFTGNKKYINAVPDDIYIDASQNLKNKKISKRNISNKVSNKVSNITHSVVEVIKKAIEDGRIELNNGLQTSPPFYISNQAALDDGLQVGDTYRYAEGSIEGTYGVWTTVT